MHAHVKPVFWVGVQGLIIIDSKNKIKLVCQKFYLMGLGFHSVTNLKY